MGTINCAREAEVDAAVAAARAAFDSWSITPAAKRAALMNKLADLIDANSDELVKAEVSSMGQPTSIMKGFIVPGTSQMFRYYAGWADKIEGKFLVGGCLVVGHVAHKGKAKPSLQRTVD